MSMTITQFETPKKNRLIRLIHMDCMDFLGMCGKYNLGIIDPPYGIGENGSTNKTRSSLAVSKDYKSFSGEDKHAPDGDFFNLITQKCDNYIFWGANHYIDNMPFIASTPCWIVWDKENGLNDFADAELAWTSFKSAVRLYRHKWQGMLQKDMKNKQQRIHPTEKPIALYRWLLQNYATEGDRILDTHGGSMSHAIACYEEEFDLDIIELDRDYYDAAVKRMQQHVSQTRLF